jgi:hypothetical protein
MHIRLQIVLLVLCVMYKCTVQQYQPMQPGQQSNQQQGLQQNIYQVLKTIPSASIFSQSLDQIASQLQDNSIVSLLNNQQAQQFPGGINPNNPSGGYTVFVPINEALTNLPTDPNQLKAQFYNFIVNSECFLRIACFFVFETVLIFHFFVFKVAFQLNHCVL